MADTHKSFRILHLTSAHSAADSRIFYKECRSLARAGYDVTQMGNYEKNGIVDGVQVRGLGSSGGRLNRATGRLVKLGLAAFRSKADLYHLHDPDLLLVGLLLRAAGRCVIYDIHEDLPTKILLKMYLPKIVRRPLSWLVARMEAVAAHFMSGLVTATPTLAARFTQVNNNIAVINNYPDLEEFDPLLGLPWHSRDAAVLYYGGISEARGILEMLEAVDSLPKSLKVRFDLAGWFYVDSLRTALETSSLWKNVCWHGALARRQLAPLLAKARVGLVILRPETSFVTSQPTKLYEYMAAEIPVIASDFALWRRIVEPSRCGLLVNPLDTKSIAGAIEYLLAHPEDAEEMGKRGREAVQSRFNWQVEEKHLLAFYATLLPQHAAAEPSTMAGLAAD